ncbi:MAG: DNA cytosine methyltransferase [Planctomycetota bacterium]
MEGDDVAVRTLELCAGYGGFSLGLRLVRPGGFRTVCMVEREAYVAAVLAARMEEGLLDQAPIWSDLATFDGRPWRGVVDLVTAGFPCQPWSVAGNQKGEDDPRWAWPHISRITEEVRPSAVFLENVSLKAFRRPRRDLVRLGFRVPPAVCIGASHVGAPHRRLRWFSLATHPERERPDPDADRWRQQIERFEELEWQQGEAGREPDGLRTLRQQHNATATADTASQRLAKREGECGDAREEQPAATGATWWSSEPPVCVLADGYPNRVDQLRATGNGVVPLVVATAWACLNSEKSQLGRGTARHGRGLIPQNG